ncbi:hypothetical protein FRB90_004938, partial [Tulasnella sp. 427]
IRHNSRLVASLPEGTQMLAREAYDISLRAVFLFTAGAAFAGWCLRLALPEFSLDRPRDEDPQRHKQPHAVNDDEANSRSSNELFEEDDELEWGTLKVPRPVTRRLSTYESDDGFDPEALAGSGSRGVARKSGR